MSRATMSPRAVLALATGALVGITSGATALVVVTGTATIVGAPGALSARPAAGVGVAGSERVIRLYESPVEVPDGSASTGAGSSRRPASAAASLGSALLRPELFGPGAARGATLAESFARGFPGVGPAGALTGSGPVRAAGPLAGAGRPASPASLPGAVVALSSVAPVAPSQLRIAAAAAEPGTAPVRTADTAQRSMDPQAGDRKAGDRKAGDRQAGDRKAADRQAGDRKAADRKAGDRKAGDRKAGDRKAGDRKAGDRKAGDRKAGDRKAGDRKAGDRKAGDRKAADRKAADRKAADRKAVHRKAAAATRTTGRR